MCKKFRFRGPFDKQHDKRAQPLFKSASETFYHIYRLLPVKLSCKKSLLWIFQILGLLVNTLATDEKYLVLNRDNLTVPSQMQLSQEQHFFSEFFAEFLKSRWNFNILKKKMTLTGFVFAKLWVSKNVVR